MSKSKRKSKLTPRKTRQVATSKSKSVPSSTPPEGKSELLDLIVTADIKENAPTDAPVRKELVSHIKKQIKDGKYDTDDKLDKALDKMIDRLLGL